MSVSRRNFVKTLGVGGAAAAILSYEGPRALARSWAAYLPESERPMLLHNNENPLGPGPKVIAAMNRSLGNGRPAANYQFNTTDLVAAISKVEGVPASNIMVGNGSTQLLRSATQVFTSKDRPLVSGSPSYEECPGYAELNDTPVEMIPLDDAMSLALGAMADASKGAGMVFVNNPNNPTGTLHSPDAIHDCIDRVLSRSNEAVVLIDEAYHDYVTDPGHRTQIPLALKTPRVIVARTFSKAHGMAGMRIGYIIAQSRTLSRIRAWHYNMSLNVPSLAGAAVSMLDRDRIEKESERNRLARAHTIDWFKSNGRKTTDSQTNFIFAETGMPAEDFRAGCLEHGIKVGRDFPPYEKSWARISISTIEDMRRATTVFGKVMGVGATSEAAA